MRGAQIALACGIALGAPRLLSAQSIVIEPAVTCCAVFPDNIYAPGTVGGAPLITGAILGVDAISYGRPLADAASVETFFSVAAGSLGAAGTALATQSPFTEAQADIYRSVGTGANTMVFDGDGVPGPTGLTAPPLGLIEGGFFFDNVNALDMRTASPSGLIYFSVDPFTAFAYGGPPVGSTAHVYVAPAVDDYDAAVPALYASEADLGLVPGDDVDALVVFDDGVAGFGAGDVVWYSLTAASPSLGMAFGPADVIEVAGPGAAPVVSTPAAALGLLDTDELDAIDVGSRPLPSRTRRGR